MRSLDRPERAVMASADDAPRVLVVEDEWLVRIAIAAFLRDEGFLVEEAADADEAVAALAAGDIDIVFSDIHMPGSLNGLDLARWIGTAYRDLPVILTSGKIHPLDTDPLGSVAGPIMLKPYSPAVVARRLRDTLRRPDAVSSAA